jgi:DNA-binding IclR family transcriptional regulator
MRPVMPRERSTGSISSNHGAAPQRKAEPAGTSTLDFALLLIEFLVSQSGPVPLAQIAAHFSASKATVYRHLVTLQRHGFVRQEADSGRYEAGVKLMVLGEALRSRFDIVSAGRAELMRLRDATEHAVTLCAMIDGELVVLELVQGRTLIDFSMRPGTRMDFHASAHGKIWLAFGRRDLLPKVVSVPLKPWTASTITSSKALSQELEQVRSRGWSTAPDQVITGVNALAAPVFQHQGELAGSIAIVGSTQYILPHPGEIQIREVLGTAERISRNLGWGDQKS